MDYQRAAERYLGWLSNDALPRSARNGLDPLGGFFEALQLDGEPITGAGKRLRVQARQAFAFARAEALGLITSGRDCSDEAFRFMIEAGFSEDDDQTPAGWVHTLKADGSTDDPRRDTYDHAFVLLAAAERWRVYRDPAAHDVAARVGAFLDLIRHPSGGFREGAPHSLPRRQNPHMHLLEASLLCRSVDFFEPAQGIIDTVVGLFDQHFWDADTRVLREFFGEDWEPVSDRYDEIEPGHMAEWVWLLAEAGHGSPELYRTMIDQAQRYGEVSGRALLCSATDSKTGEKSIGCRLWPQTEMIRACLVMARVTGEEQWYEKATRFLDELQSRFLSNAAPGCYHDNADHDGTIISERTPSSTLYHHITLADEMIRHHGSS